MNCTHCRNSLSRNTVLSAEIPSQKDCKYALCSSCGNVMIALVDDDQIIEILPTPQDNNEQTMAMVAEAARLFGQVGRGPASYGLTKDGPRHSIPRVPEEIEEDIEGHDGSPEDSYEPEEEQQEDRSEEVKDVMEPPQANPLTLSQRIGQFFKRLFGRSA